MNRLKIIADDKIPFLKGVLEPYTNINYLPGAKISADDVKDADAIFTRTRTKCDEALLRGSKVKLIATATIGFDHIDTAYCEANNIRWVNAPGCNSASVRQYVITAILCFAKENNWELEGKTIGIIGVGNVGSKIAGAAKALGMNVILNDPPREEVEGSAMFTPLDELLRKSDIVTCHTPLTKSGPFTTWHLANDDFFRLMKNNALFINTSRGTVLDSSALKRAIDEKDIKFILDVWENEPDIDRSLLEKAYIGTPHIAGYSADGKANGTAACIRELVSFFKTDFLSTDWFPAEIPPPVMEQDDVVDASSMNIQQIAYSLMTHTYPVWEDCQRLRESPEHFEKLRGDYWNRREPVYYNACLRNGQTQDISNRIKELGFNKVIFK
ncbi:MAG: 4-phosphoerythronate dehydrogenase [Tannerellaceae bacterium]|jgi:erythronate-4-phosphate dehydrogenase|nr:4-phosphoerythronate dehydrogenase [Tannerellaceae bacterium]